jgi:hypothetical protein
MTVLALPRRSNRLALVLGALGVAWLAAVVVGAPWYVVVAPPRAIAGVHMALGCPARARALRPPLRRDAGLLGR